MEVRTQKGPTSEWGFDILVLDGHSSSGRFGKVFDLWELFLKRRYLTAFSGVQTSPRRKVWSFGRCDVSKRGSGKHSWDGACQSGLLVVTSSRWAGWRRNVGNEEGESQRVKLIAFLGTTILRRVYTLAKGPRSLVLSDVKLSEISVNPAGLIGPLSCKQ